MKNFKILLILLTMTFTGSAFAYQLSESELRANIISQVKKESQKYTDGEVEVQINTLNFQGLKTNDPKAPEIKVYSNFDRYAPRDIKKVVISQNGTTILTLPVNVSVLVYKNVLVASENIGIFEALTEKNTTTKPAEVGMRLNDVLEGLNPDRQMIAGRTLQKDAVILKSYIKTKPDITRNTGVNVVFSTNDGLSIQMDGVALGEGSVGDVILVRGQKYNKIYSATIVGKNEVSVRI